MFTDKAKIFIKAGNGGNGAISWRREKYVPAGGPDGGDGGNGGNVIFHVDTGITTLMDFKYKRKYVAKTGMDGAGRRKKGKSGDDIIINVPQGTLVRDAESNLIIADLSDPEKDVVVAQGGNGGWGNSHFATAVRQAPNFAKNGQPGEEREVILELKLLADVGLVGFPNVGKSTLLSMTTAADPKIANYHFTTLEGVGLGHEFLRHIERTRVLLHVVDVSSVEGRNPIEDFEIINEELSAYDMALEERPQIIVANKTDIIQDVDVYNEFIAEMEKRGHKVFTISAATGKGVDELMKYTYEELKKLPPIITFEPQVDLEAERFVDKSGKGFEITREGDTFIITGSWIEAVGNSVTFDDNESLGYFQRALINRGVIEELVNMGIEEGQMVQIGDIEFEFVY